MTNPPNGADPRGPQTAVAPLNTIAVEDIGKGAAEFDAWLQEVSGGAVTLDRIRMVAGSVPVVGNIMALVDALGDVVTLTRSKSPDFLDWVSLGINLIGIVPVPPGMAAARMSLRPTLALVRQELRQGAKFVLGDALVEVLVGHLNATIVGELDDFVTQAQAKLPGILQDAGELGEKLLIEIAMGSKRWHSASSRRPPICSRRSRNCMIRSLPSPISLARCGASTRQRARRWRTPRSSSRCRRRSSRRWWRAARNCARSRPWCASR
ncbi:hypothetical protein GA566_23395 [Cupriavidus sp. SW-Y-13]|nr:hypothetical protein [Cupriavidus sp. SW-Y-13]